jgi:hypothetical protein
LNLTLRRNARSEKREVIGERTAGMRSRSSEFASEPRSLTDSDEQELVPTGSEFQRFLVGSGLVFSHMNAITSASSSTAFANGLPPPCPALVSILIKIGLSHP